MSHNSDLFILRACHVDIDVEIKSRLIMDNTKSILSYYFSSQLNSFSRYTLANFIKSNDFENIELSSSHTIQSSHLSGHYANTLGIDNQAQVFMLAGGSDGFISLYDLSSLNRVWDKNSIRIKTKKKTFAHKGSLSSIQFYTTDTGLFFSSSFDGCIKLFDTETFTAVDTIDLKQPVYKAKFSTDGRLIAGGLQSGVINLVDPLSGDSTHTLLGHTSACTSLDWCPVSTYLLASGSRDGSVRIWYKNITHICIICY